MQDIVFVADHLEETQRFVTTAIVFLQLLVAVLHLELVRGSLKWVWKNDSFPKL